MASSSKKSIRIDYYRILSVPLNEKDTPNGSYKAFDLQQWFMLFQQEYADFSERIFPYCGDNIRLEHLKYNKAYGLWELSFIRLRSNNLPKWGYSNKESEDIILPDDEYIGEDVCMIYDPQNSVACIQRNRNSINKNGISAYINRTWDHRDGKIIRLDPIINDIDITKKHSALIRKFHVRVSTDQESLHDCGSLSQSFETIKSMGGNFVDITISVGRSKKKKLNTGDIIDLAQNMRNNPCCESLMLSYKDNEESQVECLDLLNCTVCDEIYVDIIPKKTIPYSAILHEIIEKYINKRNLI